MSYDEEQQRKSRVVVETPTSRREVTQTETSHMPERSGMSTGTVAALVIGALALATIAFLFLRSSPTDNANSNMSTTTTTTTAATTAPTAPPPTIIQQAAPPQQAPVIIQQPAPPPAAAPVIVTQPSATGAPDLSASGSSSTARSSSSGTATDDATVQANVSKKLADASDLSTSNITATVSGGRATVTGTVGTADLKNRAERLVRTVRGVRNVDNQIVVSGSGNDSLTPPL